MTSKKNRRKLRATIYGDTFKKMQHLRRSRGWTWNDFFVVLLDNHKKKDFRKWVKENGKIKNYAGKNRP